MNRAAKGPELVVFDLDGTLTPSKAPMDGEMARLFVRLLSVKKVAVIGGGRWSLFREQLVTPLLRALRGDGAAAARHRRAILANLSLFPTTSTALYRYDRGWKNVYTLALPKRTRREIKKAFREVFREAGYLHPEKTYGPVIEDRGTQVTFSALGQDAVAVLGKRGVRLKEEWKKNNTPLKLRMAKMLAARLPGLEVHAAGFTSIDVTRKGIDKAYGVRQIERRLRVPIRKMLFVGDALFPGGNDYAARRTGVRCIAVRGPEDTKAIVRRLIAAR